MIVGIIGKLGTGKTLLATFIAYCHWRKGRKVYTNYWCEFAERIQLPADLLRISNATVVLDEAYTWLDARRGLSYSNLVISRILLAARKKDIDLIWTAQHLTSVDARLRTVTNYFIKCYGVLQKRDALYVKVRISEDPEALQYDTGIERVYRIPLKVARMYDTKRVEPLGDVIIDLLTGLLSQGLDPEDVIKVAKAQLGIPEELLKVLVTQLLNDPKSVATLLNMMGFVVSEEGKKKLEHFQPPEYDQPKGRRESKYRKKAVLASGLLVATLVRFGVPKSEAIRMVSEWLGISESTVRKYLREAARMVKA